MSKIEFLEQKIISYEIYSEAIYDAWDGWDSDGRVAEAGRQLECREWDDYVKTEEKKNPNR